MPVLPILSAAYPTRARRPAFSVLDTNSTRAMINGPGAALATQPKDHAG